MKRRVDPLRAPGVSDWKTAGLRVLLAALLLATAPSVHAQAGWPGGAGPDGSLGLAARFEGYSFDSPDAAGLESLSLLTLPFHARAALPGPLALGIRGSFARGALVGADGVETTLSGLVDTEVALGLNLEAGGFSTTIAGIVVAPTGKATHSAEEARIAALVASEFLPFRINSWGMGGAAGISVTAARPFGQGSIGFGGGFITAREFEPFQTGPAGSFVYRPGNQLQLRFAADRNITRSARLSFALAFERSGEDLRDGESLYRAGNRYQAMGSYAFTAGARSTAVVYAGALRSDEGVAFDPGLSHDFSARTLLLAGGGMRIPLGVVVLVPSVDSRLYRRDSGLGQGYLGGAGASLEIPAGDLVFAPSGRVRMGSLVVEDEIRSAITGFDVGLEIRFRR